MKWFGEPWGAPVCTSDWDEHVDVPIGEACDVCTEPFKDGDRGIVLPYSGTIGEEDDEIAYHLPCFKRLIGP